MSDEAKRIARKLLEGSKIRVGTVVSQQDLDDLFGRIATALDESWRMGLKDAENERLINFVRSNIR